VDPAPPALQNFHGRIRLQGYPEKRSGSALSRVFPGLDVRKESPRGESLPFMAGGSLRWRKNLSEITGPKNRFFILPTCCRMPKIDMDFLKERL
jgi:hypothetical protein